MLSRNEQKRRKMSTSAVDSSHASVTSNAPDSSKHHKMKQFIAASKDYLKNRAEDTAALLMRHLQALSVTIDLSIFDPHTSVVAEFFVSLHELLSNIDQRCPFCWYCVDVLSTACRNPAARSALIHTYQFLPQLSRLLGDHLTVEKKTRLLKVMQELTCGIKISWQIPHLAHLMATLTKWVESNNDEIITLSLGVLVNLCYKNLPAIYTLSRCVDTKKFVKTCIPLRGIKIEVHVCKLLIILDYVTGKVPETAILKLIDVTFKSMAEAYKAHDSLLLRHIVEFFLDVVQQRGQGGYFDNYNQYDTEVDKLLKIVESDMERGDGQQQEPECMALIFEFLHALLKLKLLKLVPLYPRMVQLALKWIQTDIVCSQALSILRTIAISADTSDRTILEPLVSGLPVFLFALDNSEEDIPTHIEHNKRMAALIQLLRSLTRCETVRNRVLQDLKVETLEKVFAPVMGPNNSTQSTRANSADTHSSEAINLYVNAVAFVHELTKHHPQWVVMHGNLMQQKQIHMILAQGLYIGSTEVKSLILKMAADGTFPTHLVSSAMSELQPLVQIDTPSNAESSQLIADSMCFPVMSVAQAEQLDIVMNRLREAIEQKNIMNVSTSDVMELYEYKLAAMGHAERAAMASVEAASQRCTHLQHRTAQLTAELTRLHQLLFHAQQCQENAVKEASSLAVVNKDLCAKVEVESGRAKVLHSQFKIKEKMLQEKELDLEETSKKLAEVSQAKADLDAQSAELKKVISKLEENLSRKEKTVEKKEEALNKLTTQNESLKMQVTQLETQLNQAESELNAKTAEVIELTREVEVRRQIINTITQVANREIL